MNRKPIQTRIRSRRSGLSMAEMVITLAVALIAFACIAQLMAITANQNRLLERDAVAAREAGNIMEDLMSRRWDELVPGNPPQPQLSEMCQQIIPDAELKIEIADDKSLAGVRQITIQIDCGSPQKRRTAARLVAWRAQDHEEVKP